MLFKIPGAVELGPAETGREFNSLPAAALLHGGIRTADVTRVAAVPRVDRTGADAADVGREEHDVRGRPAARALSDRVGHVQGEDEHQGGGRADA